MNKSEINKFIDLFEAAKKIEDTKNKNGIEFWFARDLQKLLGYDEWRNFTSVINKAKQSCEA